LDGGIPHDVIGGPAEKIPQNDKKGQFPFFLRDFQAGLVSGLKQISIKPQR
jgi:hypothetical protein